MLARENRPNAALAALLAVWPLVACASEDLRRLDPISVALADDVPPIYDDGELTIYEAKTSLMLPIAAPDADQSAALAEQAALDPFERYPWLTSEDVAVQINWTLSNLDDTAHDIWVMIDPWNEFGRYVPAITVSDDEAVRDFSGIDMLFHLPGVSRERPPDDASDAADDDRATLGAVVQAPRITGTFTFDDMDELARDFATVFKILADAAPLDAAEDDPRSTPINHAFNVRNRSYNSPLLAPYQPAIVPGLVGFDFGVRASEPVNVALEIVVEIRDHRGTRVVQRGESTTLLEPPQATIASSGGS
jgi:hypothetical protein